MAFSIIVVLAFLPNSITAAALPFRRKDIYTQAPTFVQKKIFGFPLITITGVLHAIAFATVLVVVFINPAYAGTSNGTLSPGAYAFILIALLIGIVFYPIAKAVRKRSNIDLAEAFKQIPPE